MLDRTLFLILLTLAVNIKTYFTLTFKAGLICIFLFCILFFCILFLPLRFANYFKTQNAKYITPQRFSASGCFVIEEKCKKRLKKSKRRFLSCGIFILLFKQSHPRGPVHLKINCMLLSYHVRVSE